MGGSIREGVHRNQNRTKTWIKPVEHFTLYEEAATSKGNGFICCPVPHTIETVVSFRMVPIAKVANNQQNILSRDCS